MNVINVLNDAVRRRVSEGESRTKIAEKIGCQRSQLSRTLNGNVPNLTIKTISDILWATGHEPQDFIAEAYEDISPNYVVVDFMQDAHASQLKGRVKDTSPQWSAQSVSTSEKIARAPHVQPVEHSFTADFVA